MVDECAVDDTVWGFLMTKVKENLQTLLDSQRFRCLVVVHSRLTYELLGSYASVICAR